MSERFTPYEPPEAKEAPQEAKSFSPETKTSMQGGPEATKPGDLNYPMEGGGLGSSYGDGRGGIVTPEMTEKYHSPENTPEKEPYTHRAVPVDPNPPAQPPSDTPAHGGPPSDAPPPGGPPPDPPADSPPLSPQDQATLDWVKQERERREQEVQDDLKKWDERPKPAWHRGPDDPPLNAPHLDRRPIDQINDVPRPMTETPDPNRGRRSMQGDSDA